MKTFTDIKALAKDFQETASDCIDPITGDVEYKARLVNCKMTIRCGGKICDIAQRAKKLITQGGRDTTTSNYKEWKRATVVPKIKQAAFSWSIVKDFLADGEQDNALAYFTNYDKTPIFSAGYKSKDDKIICEVMSVPNHSELVSGRLLGDKWSIFHVASGMTLASLTESATRAGSVKLLNDYDQDKLADSLKRVRENTFQVNKSRELGL